MSKIDEYIITSFKNVRKLDNDLPTDINERTFVSRFAYYLAIYIENDINYRGYKVDVEYNRKEISIKTIKDERIIPDLIVHKRKIQDNLLAIEFKKDNRNIEDKNRLENLISNKDYQYKNAYFIIINQNIVEKYHNGHWINILGDNYE